MLQREGELVEVLRRRLGWEKASGALLGAAGELGFGEEQVVSPVCAAYALLKLSFQADEVSRLLSWQDFELLAGALFRASGYRVRNNVVLVKPRVQIDVVAEGESMVLSVDCKHYRREQGPASLERVALAQLKRSRALRRKAGGPKPIASVILGMSEPEGKFVNGVAVVPVRTLRSFLTSLDSYAGYLELS